MAEQHEQRWRVVVLYDDPRGGVWRGPPETKDEAEERLSIERARVHGIAWTERT